MGFLKNMIKNGISDGISKGITKGITDAVGKAVENVVAPAADKWANKTAEQLDEATAAMDGAAKEAEAAKKENPSGFAALEGALGKWAESAEKYAGELEKNYAEELAEEDQKTLASWVEKLPGFPVWCFGGKEYDIAENGIDPNGRPYYYFNVRGVNEAALHAYIALLKSNGFTCKYPGSDEVLYKKAGEDVYIVGTTDALFDDGTGISLGFSRDPSELQ